MKINTKYNWLILIQILLILLYCIPLSSYYLHGLVYFLPLLIVTFILFIVTPYSKPTFKVIKYSLRSNLILFILLLWYVAGIAFSFLRYAENTNFLMGVLLLPFIFIYGLYVNSKPQYHKITVIYLVTFLFLNTFFTGKEIGINLSARDMLIASRTLTDAVGAAGYWGIIGIFFPILLVNIKDLENKYLQIAYIGVLIYLLYKLLFAGFATALVLLVINAIVLAILFLFYRKKSVGHFLVSLIVLAVTIVGVYYFINWILISNLEGLAPVQWRISNIIKDPTSGGYIGNYTSRYDLFFVSLNTFQRYPIFGSGADIMSYAHFSNAISAGGHSSFIDVLAILGLLGGGGAIIFFTFKALLNKILIMRRNKKIEDICQTSVIITFIVGGILNPYWNGSIFIIFLLITPFYRIPSSYLNHENRSVTDKF